jgi:putative addiction module killer protein
MYEVQKTDEFESWLSALADQRAVAKIVSRIERLVMGNPGDAEPVGDGISEMKINYGPGYRVYYKRTGKTVMLIVRWRQVDSRQRHQAGERDSSAALKGNEKW